MKKSNAQQIQKTVILINNAHNSETSIKDTRDNLATTLVDMHDEAQATSFIVDVMYQAILQGLANTVINSEGKRNDKASNWKRDLAKALNTAYESETHRTVLKTSGKGIDRTVTIARVEKAVPLTGKDAFLKKLENLLGEVNVTPAELNSLSSRCEALYTENEKVQFEVKESQRIMADKAKADALATTTAIIAEQLESKGIKATKANIQVAMAMNA